MTPTLVAYLSVTFILAITPGATTTVVIRQALAGGWRAGLTAAAGAALGNSAHATLAAFGLVVVVHRWPVLLQGVRLGGGLYLAWLSVKGLRRAAFPPSSAGWSARSVDEVPEAAFQQGVLTNLLNPSVVTFYLVVVPTFLPAGSGAGPFAVLAACHIAIAFGCHAAWATAFDQVGHIFSSAAAHRILSGATAVALLGLAVRVFIG
jgi:threonine/homoserine/homoserine lactone efflux protein